MTLFTKSSTDVSLTPKKKKKNTKKIVLGVSY